MDENNLNYSDVFLDKPISLDDLETPIQFESSHGLTEETITVDNAKDFADILDRPISLDDLESPIQSKSSQEELEDNLKLINVDNDLDFINIDDEYNVVDYKKAAAKMRDDFIKKHRLASFLTKIEKNLSSKFESKVQNEDKTKEVLDQALDKVVSDSLDDSIEVDDTMMLDEQGRGK